jgi:serine protease Do
MRNSDQRTATWLLVLIAWLAGAVTECLAGSYSRKSPIVEAVQKTRGGIVTVKVDRKTSAGRKEVIGTGVVVDERGYVITNCHVVTAADRIKVAFADGSIWPARIHTEVEDHDLAILKVSTTGPLQALTFGPGSDLMVGETVIVVGNPFGYTNSVSTGIISALGRQVPMPGGIHLTNLIQTNASINPGNSGGPLLNINGELIGIAVAIRDGAQGIAFALNADTVQEVLSIHLSAGKVARLGHGLNLRHAVQPEGEDRQHVIVAEVAERSPAAKAGLQTGDVILKVGDRCVANRFDIERALWRYKAGDTVQTTVLRDGKEKQVELRLTRSGAATNAVARREGNDRSRHGDRYAKPVEVNR